MPTPCPGTSHVAAFLVSVEGEVLHRCDGSLAIWRDSTGAEVRTDPLSDPLLALGAFGWALSPTRIVNWKTSTETPIIGLPTSFNLLAKRWSSRDGFWLAITTLDSDELWRISTSGVAQRVGVLGAFPSDSYAAFGARLDSSGRLFHMGRISGSFIDIVVVREVGAPATVVYMEATNPLVWTSTAASVTRRDRAPMTTCLHLLHLAVGRGATDAEERGDSGGPDRINSRTSSAPAGMPCLASS